ncbi:MAG: hypothetical protein HYY99_01730 [Candidatus Colwellbacteria bacterium]|nr:hypothetical protein [Candidatus Colwellbacteria bacterium]
MPWWLWLDLGVVLFILWLPLGAGASRIWSELYGRKGSKVLLFSGPIGCLAILNLIILELIGAVAAFFVLLMQAGQDFLLPAGKSKLRYYYNFLLRVANIPT